MSEDGWNKMMDGSPIEVAEKIGHIDAQAAVLIGAMGSYEEEFNTERGEDGWDWPVFLMMIYRSLPPPELAEQISTVLGGQAFLVQMKFINLTEIGINCDDGPDLGFFLGWFADQMAKDSEAGQAAMLSDLEGGATDLLAWGVHLEGYEVGGGKDIPRPTGRFKDDPRSVECRIVMAVDRAGYRYTVRRIRPTDEVGAVVDMDLDAKLRLGGRVMDGLSAVMAATPSGVPDD